MQEIPETGFMRLPQVLSVIPLGKTCWWEGLIGSVPEAVELSGDPQPGGPKISGNSSRRCRNSLRPTDIAHLRTRPMTTWHSTNRLSEVSIPIGSTKPGYPSSLISGRPNDIQSIQWVKMWVNQG